MHYFVSAHGSPEGGRPDAREGVLMMLSAAVDSDKNDGEAGAQSGRRAHKRRSSARLATVQYKKDSQSVQAMADDAT